LLLRREKFYKWKSYFQFRLNLKKNQNRKRYYLFFKKSTNNTFLTVTDSKGNVIISKSAGSCKIKTKKKKKSRDTLQDISRVLIRAILLKNIKYIYTMFMWNGWVKNARIIGREFVIKKIKILGIKNLILKSHSKPMKKKKPKRR
jgi:ribosomal protein S11